MSIYQNKYRNVASKQPERIERLMRECGIENGTDEARKRIEEEINGLYDKLATSLKEENKRLFFLTKFKSLQLFATKRAPPAIPTASPKINFSTLSPCIGKYALLQV